MRSLWLVSREYAGLAEAGGVKHVARALCEGLSRRRIDVTLFIPLYGCTDMTAVSDYKTLSESCTIEAGGDAFPVSWACGKVGSVRTVFIINSLFVSRKGVYTYTAEEELENVSHKRGVGHAEALIMDVLFQKAVLSYGLCCSVPAPDIIHCQDAAAALVPVFALNISEYGRYFAGTKYAVTIHNAGPGYRHEFASLREASKLTSLPETVLTAGVNPYNNDSVEPFLLCSHTARLTTVSPWYAEELLLPDNKTTGGLSALFAEKQTAITGITNGIDYENYDPETPQQSLLPYAFSPIKGNLEGKYACRKFFADKYGRQNIQHKKVCQFGFVRPADSGSVWFSYHGRLVVQKGLAVLADAIPVLLERHPEYRFVINGQGDTELERLYVSLADRYEGQCVYFRGYDRSLARLTTAVGDFLILPSNFEPCGLEDFIGQIYGTIPVAHATGGLNKIIHGKTGYLYEDNTPGKLAETLEYAAGLFYANPSAAAKMVQDAAQFVHTSCSWDHIIQTSYLPLYNMLCSGSRV